MGEGNNVFTVLFLVLGILQIEVGIGLSSVETEANSAQAEGYLQSQAKDTQHLKEHLQHEFGLDEETAAKYLKDNDANAQFFLMHDTDNNSKLDGLEILNSLSHNHNEDPNHKPEENQTEEQLTSFVDLILNDQDLDKDGYISYAEFIRFMNKQQQEHEEQQKQENQSS